MNRTDRLLAIILELQGKGQQTAEALATTFEVTKRTIYRDMQALLESGVPIVSQAGRGYQLIEGYFLPPIHLTTDEAILLLLGSDVMAQTFDEHYQTVAGDAARKILAALPEALRSEVRNLQQSLLFIEQGNIPSQVLGLVRHAIVAHQSLAFDYQGRQSAQPDPIARQVDPYGLVHVAGAWYLTAYCHLRRDLRKFRLDRMRQLTLLPRRFARPHLFSLIESNDQDPRPLQAQVLFDDEVAPWVQETPFYFITQQEATPDGLLVTLHIRHERDILQWVLGWGRHARVIAPESLRHLIQAEARAMLEAD